MISLFVSVSNRFPFDDVSMHFDYINKISVMENNSSLTNTGANTLSVESIATLAAGTLLLLSGLIHIRNVGATIKTVLGGILLYKGLTSAFEGDEMSVSSEGDAGLAEAESLIVVTE